MNNNSLRVKFIHQIIIAAFSITSINLSYAADETGNVYVRGDIDSKLLLARKSGIYTRVSDELLTLQEDFLTFQAQQSSAKTERFKPAFKLMNIADGYVVVDAVAEGNASALYSDLLGLGAVNVAVHKSIVSARVPITSISAIAALDSLRYVHPVYVTTNIGATDTQGDVAQASVVARGAPNNVDGTGITVGIMSDSYDCIGAAGMGGVTAADDVASHDLPGDPMTEPAVNVLLDSCPGGSDEGRGMAQIVADVAPGAALAFRTAFLGRADFANGIAALVTAGADVIVDDVFYFREPMFQDGIIAQAVDTAVTNPNGVAYFSSAGNSAKDSYESRFMDSGFLGPSARRTHDFDPGVGISNLQQITVPTDGGFTMTFQWNQPFANVNTPPGPPGASTDLDIWIIGSDLSTILGSSLDPNIAIGDAVEEFVFNNPGVDLDNDMVVDTIFFVLIENFAGPNPDLIKYSYSGSGVTIDAFPTNSGTSFGHASAVGAESIGAVFFFDTPAFSRPLLLESFSSAGNVPIFFGLNGVTIDPPDLRLKPEVTGPDGGNTTFFGGNTVIIPSIGEPDGFPNFFGTSASAPHVAGVAALMLEFDNTLTPVDIYAALEDSALDMNTGGYDFDSGFGFIQADAAISALANNPPTWTAPINGQLVNTSHTIVVPISASDPDGNSLALSEVGRPSFCTPLNDNGNGTGDITCIPGAAHAGRYAIAVTATDNGTPPRSDSVGFYLDVRRVRYSDHDGNRKSDIWWRNGSTGVNWMYLMNGPTIASSVGINTISTAWQAVGNGDYDGDGDADILLRNGTTGVNWMYLMNGSMIDSSVGVNTVSTAWQVVGSGDYNGDGKSDILWFNSSTGVIWMYQMNGSMIDSSEGVTTIGSSWQVVASGNYDGDRDSDILLRNGTSGVNWIYFMDGTVIDSSVAVNTVGTAWQVVGSGDYNGDGNSDILLHNNASGVIWMYLMTGATIDVSQGINSIGPFSSVVGNGDYDGDGYSDILLRSVSNGENWMYLMNGTSITNNVTVNTVGAAWQVVNSN